MQQANQKNNKIYRVMKQNEYKNINTYNGNDNNIKYVAINMFYDRLLKLKFIYKSKDK